MSEDFVAFKCHNCNHCCTDVVCLLTPWDVRRIMRMTGKDPYEFIEFLTPDEIKDVDEAEQPVDCGRWFDPRLTGQPVDQSLEPLRLDAAPLARSEVPFVRATPRLAERQPLD